MEKESHFSWMLKELKMLLPVAEIISSNFDELAVPNPTSTILRNCMDDAF